MPFTISHVAAVLPGYRPLSRLQVFSAAVIGSMVPDFGLLLPEKLSRWQTHSLHGLFTFCLPVGLASYALTQWLVKPAVVEVAPPAAYARLRSAHPAAPLTRPGHWLLAAAAVLLGALTHLVWDAFTHEDGRGARMFPVLSDYGPEMGGHSLHFYRFAQYASSVFGLLVVGAALLLWLYHAHRQTAAASAVDATATTAVNAAFAPRRMARAERIAWGALYLLVPLAATGWAIAWPALHGHSPFATGAAIGHVAVVGLRSLAVALLGVSAAIRLRLG